MYRLYRLTLQVHHCGPDVVRGHLLGLYLRGGGWEGGRVNEGMRLPSHYLEWADVGRQD